MGRDDAGLPAGQSGAKAVEPSTELDQQRNAAGQAQVKKVEKRVLNSCPHCGVRLSALDIKLNKCFKCWAVLDSEAMVKPRAGSTGLEVHI